MPSLARRAVAELLGTLAFVLLACGAVVMNAFPDARYGLLGIALATATAYAAAVSMTLAISGGMLNPALTIGLVAGRRLPVRDGAVYVVAQLAGALLGAALLRLLLPSGVGDLLLWGTPTLHVAVDLAHGIGIETVLTFVLMAATLGTISSPTAPRLGGLGVGLLLFAAMLVGGPLTGAALNPARAFGPALVSGNMTAQAVWWIGPIIGAVVAAVVWQWVAPRE